MVLLLVLVIVALLAALLTQLAFSTLVDLRLTETFRDSTRAYYLTKGGIQVGRMVLADDKNNYDGADELWAQGITNYPVGDIGVVSITITAIDGKVNINGLINSSGNIDAVIKDRCLRLFEVAGIDNAAAHVDTLIDWIDPDNDPQPDGAEADYYAHQTPPAYCKNGELSTVEELQLVAGFTKEEVDKLRPHITVYGDGKIHLNSASAIVLCSLAPGMDIDSAEMIVNQLKDNAFHSVEELKLLPGWENFYWAINTFLTVKAKYYTITSSSEVNDGHCRASAVVKKEGNSLLYLHID